MRKGLLLVLSALLIVATMAACRKAPPPEIPDEGKGSSPGASPALKIPDDILADFKASPAFETMRTEPSDIAWHVCREEGGRRVVAATFKAKNSMDILVSWYFFAIYGPEVGSGSPERILTRVASLENADFNIAAGVSAFPGPDGMQVRQLRATGFAGDVRISRVTVETSSGRKFDAQWYGRFWVVLEAVHDPAEKFLQATAYAAEGSVLYQIPKRLPPPSPR